MDPEFTEDPPEVSEFFEHDHEELDASFEAYRELKNEDFERAREYFRDFYRGLRTHIQWEDEVLFPAFEAEMGDGLTGTMRVEHEQIKEALEVLHSQVIEGEKPPERDEERLLKFLEPHNESEEIVLYPAIDRHLDESTIQNVFDQLKPEDHGTD